MCGAIGLDISRVPRSELERFFTAEEITEFEKKREVVFAFWARRPVLPVQEAGGIRLREWGDRTGVLHLPKTGWAKLESLRDGKWDRLHPKEVRIPASRGCEKRIWFDLTKDIKGILVTKDGEERVYMVTEEASPQYKEMTKHDRMPNLCDGSD